ncbi:MAG: SRPBCC family protein [Bacteroidota bacterium]
MKFFITIFLLGVMGFQLQMSYAQDKPKKLHEVTVKVKINAPAERVWEAMVLDYGEISNFSPYIYSSNYERGSLKGELGAERTCSFNEKGTQWVHERIKSIDHDKMVMKNQPINGAKIPMDFENTFAYYKVSDNGDGTSTATYELYIRTKPAFMGAIAKGGFKKQLIGTLIGLKHYVETGETVTPMNKRYDKIKIQYPTPEIVR